MSIVYRIVKETHLIVTKDGKPDLLTLPEGAIVNVEEQPSIAGAGRAMEISSINGELGFGASA